MSSREQAERARFQAEVLDRMPADDRGVDPAEYDLNSKQLRELAAKVAAGAALSPGELHRREVNNKAGRARRAELAARSRKRHKPAERARAKERATAGPADADGRRRLAHNPLGPDDPGMVYWRLPGGSVLAEPKPTGSLTLRPTLEDLAELDLIADRRGESRVSYASRVLAGHVRGLRNARTPKPPPAPVVSGEQQLPGQTSLV